MDKEVDQMIQDFGAEFIYRIHFDKSVMKLIEFRRKTVKGLPSQGQLPALLQARHRDDLQGSQGLKCLGVEPKSGETFDLIIKAKEEKDQCSFECDDWGKLVSEGNIQENDVVSLWLYYEENSDSPSNTTAPGILFRVDENCKEGEPFPQIPKFPDKGSN